MKVLPESSLRTKRSSYQQKRTLKTKRGLSEKSYKPIEHFGLSGIVCR